MKKKIAKKFDQQKEVRAIARERVGLLKASRVVVPKTERKKPKYRERLGEE